MPVVPIYLDIDEKTYAGVKAGALELYGLAKNVDNKRVAKHIPAVADTADSDKMYVYWLVKINFIHN